MFQKFLRSVSSLIFWNSRVTSRIRRAKSGEAAMARMQKPERTCAAPKSSEPVVHASDNTCTSEGLKTGVRALPVLSLSRLEVRSRQAETRCGFEAGARRIVQFSDEPFQVGGHGLSFLITKPGLCPQGSAQ